MTITRRNCLLIGSLILAPFMASAQDEPRQGMSMDEVRASHGAPAYDLGAVGSPAITRWVYDGYTVYFENRRVLHTVRTQPLSSSAAAAPAPEPATRPVEPVAAPAPTPAVTAMPAPEVPVLAPVSDPDPEPAAIPTTAQPAPETAMPPETMAQPETMVQPETAATPAATAEPKTSGFRFDPATGRLILDSEEAPPEAATPQATESAPAPDVSPTRENPPPTESPEPAKNTEPANDNLGSALDETLEFDPNTGTFRSAH